MILATLDNLYANINIQTVACAIPVAVILYHVIPFLLDPQGIRKYPGPFLAKFTDFYLAYISKGQHRSEILHDYHLKHGPIIRIAPNHISIADPDALNAVYGHGNGTLKSDFYDAFVSIHRGLFNVRDRQDHTRKRKIIAHIFSQKSVIAFEPKIQMYVGTFMKQWDRLFDMAVKGQSGDDGEGGWEGKNGRLYLDVLPWTNYLAFDMIGDLAFGESFGMLENLKDIALAPKDPKSMMEDYGKEGKKGELIPVPAISILNTRGEFNLTMSAIPPRWRPLVRLLPGFSQGSKAVQDVAGMAITAVSKRLATPTDRVDLLSKLQSGRDSDGNPMSREELTAEALTLLVAGSDTTSNSTCAIFFFLAQNRQAQDKLHKELDEQLGTEDEFVATAEQIKRLPYLEACINEGLRIHSTSGIGLPRIVPEGGMTYKGEFFPGGTILSVPSYSLHRDPAVWGEDFEDFRPERWFERDQAAMNKAFNPYSLGPRGCVGRNLAAMEIQIFIASVMRRYDLALETPGQKMEVAEGFLRKPLQVRLGIKRRDL
ncbi:cytochrome P450 monooxygenase [Macrolepiota fuliginosa MF-IS2]|uniref:Cytochrome P450 monooxygenase n=1 Tax=Macrolepiota fuliginosa MF-IS2 TaxID=1400762 RepID=A0A9P6C2M3_9AGAR|nr:cytochrome P450 monooxygenase [Macrolepiota fuliginosa MF-IS2]